jgi:hypothetical protein
MAANNEQSAARTLLRCQVISTRAAASRRGAMWQLGVPVGVRRERDHGVCGCPLGLADQDHPRVNICLAPVAEPQVC